MEDGEGEGEEEEEEKEKEEEDGEEENGDVLLAVYCVVYNRLWIMYYGSSTVIRHVKWKLIRNGRHSAKVGTLGSLTLVRWVQCSVPPSTPSTPLLSRFLCASHQSPPFPSHITYHTLNSKHAFIITNQLQQQDSPIRDIAVQQGANTGTATLKGNILGRGPSAFHGRASS